ncbi:hypothetical protein [Streptomyces sp. HUAS TT7]|uniref:hypothetical protein n=1 Tax=Streptomyces sp. HUAS TT7 TaxID=3447507 RepID=UPI003F658F17
MPHLVALKLRDDVRRLCEGRRHERGRLHLRPGPPRGDRRRCPDSRARALAFHGCPGHGKGAVRLERDALVREGPNFAYHHGDGPKADIEGAKHQSAIQTSWARFPADSALSTAQWLEREVRTFPMDCYPVGPAHGPRLPADIVAAAAADQAVTQDGFAVFMEGHGCP